MSYELTEDSLRFFEIETRSCSFVIKVKDFSNETIHKSGKPADIEKYIFEHQDFFVDLYANGMTSEDRGNVTVKIVTYIPRFALVYKAFEFFYVFNLIDASGNKKFPQSCVFNVPSDLSSGEEHFHPVVFERLLKRDFLLSDPDDLLPGDCLSLHIDVETRTIDYGPYTSVKDVVRDSFPFKKTADGMNVYLDLDSELAKRLAGVSAYFQRLLETTMVERETRHMRVDMHEYPPFMDVCQILMGAKEITVSSISDICQMYIAADKYDIPIAVGSSRDLLTTLLGVEDDPATAEDVRENVPTLMELAETYNDARLKENIESFLKNDREDGEYDGCTHEKLQNNLLTEWKFKRVGDKITNFFAFVRNIEERPGLNFYK